MANNLGSDLSEKIAHGVDISDGRHVGDGAFRGRHYAKGHQLEA